jgi:hypothetical protein
MKTLRKEKAAALILNRVARGHRGRRQSFVLFVNQIMADSRARILQREVNRSAVVSTHFFDNVRFAKQKKLKLAMINKVRLQERNWMRRAVFDAPAFQIQKGVPRFHQEARKFQPRIQSEASKRATKFRCASDQELAVIKIENKRALVAEVKITRDRSLTEAMTIARIQSMARVASAKSLVELKKAKKIGILEKRRFFLYDPAAHREQAAAAGGGHFKGQDAQVSSCLEVGGSGGVGSGGGGGDGERGAASIAHLMGSSAAAAAAAEADRYEGGDSDDDEDDEKEEGEGEGEIGGEVVVEEVVSRPTSRGAGEPHQQHHQSNHRPGSRGSSGYGGRTAI